MSGCIAVITELVEQAFAVSDGLLSLKKTTSKKI